MTIQDFTGIAGSPETDQGSTKEANGVKEDDETTVKDVNGLPVLKADGTRQKMKRKKSRRGLAGRKGDAPGLISSRDLLVNEGAGSFASSRPTQTPNRTTSNGFSRKNSIMRKKSSVLETSDDGDIVMEDNSSTRLENGISVGFSDLSYAVPIQPTSNVKDAAKSLTILHSISGTFLPGKMSALMGPSGSGKTSLLDCLAGRKNAGEITGNIMFNGKKPKISDYRRLVGYVEQFDTLVGELTVEQMLAYTAALKLPSSTTSEERRERVNEVITRLDLEVCRHTVIGSALVRGISGGQAKRVNIGLAMITRPKILFLDEPTRLVW